VGPEGADFPVDAERPDLVAAVDDTHDASMLAAGDAGEIRMYMLDKDDSGASLLLPADCLQQLLMTVPQMVDKSLQARFGDRTLRFALPLSGWRIEHAHAPDTLLLAIETPDGFKVTFGLTEAISAELGKALLSGHELPRGLN
jgi:hypothetical protein